MAAPGIRPAALAEALFKKRWRDASIKDEHGRIVGEVTLDEHGGCTWWGER